MPSKEQVSRRRITLTGGGTAGHVIPNMALIPSFKARGWDYEYIGSEGMERELAEQMGVRFKCIAVGKLRRYFSVENFIDVFKVFLGIIQSLVYFIGRRPDVLFSKGGYVSVPPCVAAWVLRIPVVSHESDLTPGLATRIIMRFAKRVFYQFPETCKYLGSIGEFSGPIIREELFKGSRSAGCEFAGLDPNGLPVLLFMGGSLGAEKINRCLYDSLDALLGSYQIIHITGKGKKQEVTQKGYAAFEYVTGEMKDVLAVADMVVARAGANSIFEFLALKKPMLLIPLEEGSRGDQLDNAKSFVKEGWAHMLRESDLTPEKLCESIARLQAERGKLLQAVLSFQQQNGIVHIASYLNNL